MDMHCKDNEDDLEPEGSTSYMDTPFDDEIVFKNKWRVNQCEGLTMWERLGDDLEKKATPPTPVEIPLPKGYKEEELFKRVFKDETANTTA
jgi:hypothetical protein